jgi:hypothetical protein
MEITKFNVEDFIQLKNNVELIKNLLIMKDNEGELTDWARKELTEARCESDDDLTSLEDLRMEIENGL